jgi:hypothetical protein
MSANCPHCDARWSGNRICHCARCHLTFTGGGGFDAHMVVLPDTGGRTRCLTPDELRARAKDPMRPNDRGQWGSAVPDPRYAPAQTPEQPPAGTQVTPRPPSAHMSPTEDS